VVAVKRSKSGDGRRVPDARDGQRNAFAHAVLCQGRFALERTGGEAGGMNKNRKISNPKKFGKTEQKAYTGHVDCRAWAGTDKGEFKEES